MEERAEGQTGAAGIRWSGWVSLCRVFRAETWRRQGTSSRGGGWGAEPLSRKVLQMHSLTPQLGRGGKPCGG